MILKPSETNPLRWDETPRADMGETPGHASGWLETPRTGKYIHKGDKPQSVQEPGHIVTDHSRWSSDHLTLTISDRAPDDGMTPGAATMTPSAATPAGASSKRRSR